jgi:hypothetical protein
MALFPVASEQPTSLPALANRLVRMSLFWLHNIQDGIATPTAWLPLRSIGH